MWHDLDQGQSYNVGQGQFIFSASSSVLVLYKV